MKKTLCLFFVTFLFFTYSYAQESKDWEVFKSTHFLIYYKNVPVDFISGVSTVSEKYYNAIAEDLGFSRLNFWSWDDRAKIYIYDDVSDYQRQTGEPSWSQGRTVPGYKIIQSYFGAQEFLESTLPHEMSHIIFREFVGFNNPAVPLWLDEGVSSYQEKIKFAGTSEILRDAMEKKVFMDLLKLTGFKDYPLEYGSESVRLFYAESFSLIEYLMKKFGRDKFVTFCQDLRDKRSFEGALSSGYNFADLKEMDQAWQDYIKNE